MTVQSFIPGQMYSNPLPDIHYCSIPNSPILDNNHTSKDMSQILQIRTMPSLETLTPQHEIPFFFLLFSLDYTIATPSSLTS